MESESSKGSNIVKQGAILAFAGIFVRFIGFLYRMPLTDMLGDRGNAVYSSGYYIYTLFLIISSAGLPSAISKMVSERIALNKYREAHAIFRVSMLFAFCSGFICMLILFFGAETLENFGGGIRGSRYAIMTLAPTVFIVSIMSVYRGYFQGMKNSKPTAVSQIVEQILNAVFSILMCYIFLNAAFSQSLVGGSIAGGAAGGTIGTGVGAFFGLVTLMIIYNKKSKEILKKVRRDKTRASDFDILLKELIFTAIPIILGAAVFSITNIIDMNMIMGRLLSSGSFSRPEAEALYGQLTGKYLVLTSLPISISTSLSTASIPEIAEEIALNHKKRANSKINFTVKLTMIISIPAAVGMSVLANQLLWLLFPSYREGGILLMVGGISVIFLALTQILGGMLQGISKFYIPVMAAICGAIVKIILNYTLVAIPSINVVGAVIGTIFCYLVASMIDLHYLQKIIGLKLDKKNIFAKPIISSLLMGVAVYFSYKGIFSLLNLLTKAGYFSNAVALFASIFIGGALYFVVLYKMNGITDRDISAMPFGNRILAKIKK